MRLRYHFCFAVLLWLTGQPAVVRAGMPAPLPTDTDIERVLRLNDTALGRLQAISFFFLGLLLVAGAVQGLWNYFRRDFASLPRLSFGRALAGVSLWGLLFIVVLTMIAGARELMTPGAWRKQGFTYRLAEDTATSREDDPASLRRHNLERLRTALWHFAATHQGRFPSQEELAALAPDLWDVPESGGLRYRYVSGLSADQTATVLVYEPELEPERRFVLQTDGAIVAMRSAKLGSLLKAEGQP